MNWTLIDHVEQGGEEEKPVLRPGIRTPISRLLPKQFVLNIALFSLFLCRCSVAWLSPRRARQINQQTSCSWMLIEKLICAQLLKKFPAFYKTRWLITMFVRAHHWSLPALDESSSQSPNLNFNIRFNIVTILSLHLRLGLPYGLFSSGFPTIPLHALLFYHIHATCSDYFILLVLNVLIILMSDKLLHMAQRIIFSTGHMTPRF
jgi:hypothetical protein